VSKKKRRAYFGGNNFPPSVDKIVLADKTIIPFWWKRPDELLQHLINFIFKLEERLFEIANVEHLKDDTTILKDTVLKKVVEGLRVIQNGSRFIVRSDENGSVSLVFTRDDNEEVIHDVPISLYMNGDMNILPRCLDGRA
jgi:hypothetical protein